MKIYVVGSSKNKFLPLDDIREKFLIDEKHEGDNIDFLNPWYCELTGLYYLWKHVDDDIVGLEHYRRYFLGSNGKILGETEIRNVLKNQDAICIKNAYNRYPPKTWLIKNNKWLDMQKFLIFIKHYIGEDYYNTCVNHLNGNWHALGNLCIFKKEIFDNYCKFIFDILFTYMEAEKSYNRNLPGRICGYFTEFLLGAWLVYNKINYSFYGVKITR